MDWFKKHGDTITILSVFAACFWNMNEKMNAGFRDLDKDIAIIKTVMIMKNIMPTEVAFDKEKTV